MRAPRFSTGSATSISFATVTPSLVIVGEPNFLSMTTLRPLGPRVTFTASARASTPRLSFARASVLKSSSLAAIVSLSWSAELGENVGGLDDHDLFAPVGDVGPAVLPVEHRVADLEVDRHPLPILEPARPDGDHFALGRLLLGGVGDVEPAPHRLHLVIGPDDHPVLERLDVGLLGLRLRHR